MKPASYKKDTGTSHAKKESFTTVIGLKVDTWFKRTHYEGADITTNLAVFKGKASAVLKHFVFH